jgi:Domain of unknown function (DUF4390)
VRRLLLLVILTSLCAAPLAAADPAIANLSATAVGPRISVKFNLRDAFTDEQIVKSLQSGLPTGFTYTVELYRDRPYWLDEGIARARIDVIATFNSVTREYLLNYRRDKLLVRSETFMDVEALKRRMTAIDEPNLFDSDGWRPYKLKVRVKADVTRGVVLYVIPWDSSTRWREARVRQERP